MSGHAENHSSGARDIVDTALSLVNEIVPSVVLRRAPIDVNRIARYFDVKDIEPKYGLRSSGFVTRNGGHFLIGYDARHSYARRRFTIAHEIGHIAFSFLRPWSIEESWNRASDTSSQEERDANAFAARLLMPDDLIRAELLTNGSSWASFRRIREHFAVSSEALAIRFTEIPGVWAAFLRVAPHDETLPIKKVALSRHRTPYLRSRLSDELNNMIQCYRSGKPYLLSVDVEDSTIQIPVVGQRVVRDQSREEIWFVGWRCDLSAAAVH